MAEILNIFFKGTTRTETSQEIPTQDSSRITDHIVNVRNLSLRKTNDIEVKEILDSTKGNKARDEILFLHV